MKVIDTYNAIVGAAVAVLSYIFGEHWILFALFLAFNVADWITGWMKARLTHKENSKAGWKGVLKKLRLLDHDCGSLWGICSVCGDWKDAWR